MIELTRQRVATNLQVQRGDGWYVILEDVLPRLAERLERKTDIEVFIRAYEIQHPTTDANSPDVVAEILKDFDAYYEGGHFPKYVFDTYIRKLPQLLTAAE